MSRIDKKLEKWGTKPSTDAPVDEVVAVLDRFFDGCYENKAGSHIVVRHEKLVGVSDFGPMGELTIAVKGGQRVKGIYLKRLVLAIEILRE